MIAKPARAIVLMIFISFRLSRLFRIFVLRLHCNTSCGLDCGAAQCHWLSKHRHHQRCFPYQSRSFVVIACGNVTVIGCRVRSLNVFYDRPFEEFNCVWRLGICAFLIIPGKGGIGMIAWRLGWRRIRQKQMPVRLGGSIDNPKLNQAVEVRFFSSFPPVSRCWFCEYESLFFASY